MKRTMKFIGNIDQVLLMTNCKNIKEFAENVKYSHHYISSVLNGNLCTKRLAMKISNYIGLPLQTLFEEET